MFERLENIKAKYEEVSNLLTDPEIMSDFNKLKDLSKEQSDLKEVVDKYAEYQKIEDELAQAKEMLNDSELKEFAEEEMARLTEEKEKVYGELEILLVPKDENDGKNVIMEIRGAAGGDEANIFAGDLFRMYTYYAEKNGWKIEVINTIKE